MKLFLSFRFDPDQQTAQTLASTLESMGAQVFFAKNSIPPGNAFPSDLRKALASCNAVLVVVGKDWAEKFVAAARASPPATDWVLYELQEAVGLRKRIVPVYMGGTRFPRATEFPESIRSIASLQSYVLHEESFQRDASALLRSLEPTRPRFPVWAAVAAGLLVAGSAWWMFLGKSAHASGYLETSGVIYHRVGAHGAGVVTSVHRIAPLEKIVKSLESAPHGSRATEADLQLASAAEGKFHDEDYEASADRYRQLWARHHDNANVGLNYGVTLILIDPLTAVTVLREVFASPATPAEVRGVVLSNLAQAMIAAADPGASALADSALAMDPNDAVAANAKGVLSYVSGDYDQATTWFRQAVKDGSGMPAQDLNVATSLLDDGKTEAAAKLLDTIETEHQKNLETEALRGRIELDRGDVQAAADAFRRALAMNLDRGDIAYNAVLAWQKIGVADSIGRYSQIARAGGIELPGGSAQPTPASASSQASSPEPSHRPQKTDGQIGNALPPNDPPPPDNAPPPPAPEVTAVPSALALPNETLTATLHRLEAERDTLPASTHVSDAYRGPRMKALIREISRLRGAGVR